jgi:flagellar basal body-associated protein FliL
MSQHPLAQVYQFIQSGQASAARPVLARYLREHPDSPEGWYLLSQVLTDPGKQIESLHKALELKPDFEPARKKLDELTRPAEGFGDLPDLDAIQWPETQPEGDTSDVPQPETSDSPEVSPEEAFARLVEKAWGSPDETAESPPAEVEAPFIPDMEAQAPPAEPAPEAPAVMPDLPPGGPVQPEAPETPEPEAPEEPELTPEEQLRRTASLQAQAPKPPSRRRLLWLVLILVAIAAAVALVFIFFFGMRGGLPFTAGAEPLPTVVVAATAVPSTPTPAIQDLPPTWTNTPPPTPAGTATPTPILTLPPPDAAMASEMESIQVQVVALRGLSPLGEVPSFMVPEERVREILESLVLKEDADLKTEAADQVRVLSALGLIEPTYDLYTKMLNNQGDSLGGFYVPWTQELFVIGEDFSILERFIFSHEFAHALADQHFELGDIGVYPECELDSQHCEAIRALVEGDASLLMYQWLAAHTSEEEQLDIFLFDPPTEIISSADFPPPYVVREQEFRYGDGLLFVEKLHQLGTWALVDLAYQNLPLSTEQILHPQKYLDGETPIPVAPAALEAVLGDGWRLLETDVLGELMTGMILGYGVEAITQLDPETAADAAAGWGGDSYQVLYKGSTNEKVLAVHWVWDTPEDAQEFTEAMETYLTRRFAGVQVSGRPGCWERLNQEVSCLFAAGIETLWILAPDLQTLDLVTDQFSQFQ